MNKSSEVESRLKSLMVGKTVSVSQGSSIFLPTEGECRDVRAVPAGQDSHFEVELVDGTILSILPSVIAENFVEGGIGKASGTRRFEWKN